MKIWPAGVIVHGQIEGGWFDGRRLATGSGGIIARLTASSAGARGLLAAAFSSWSDLVGVAAAWRLQIARRQRQPDQGDPDDPMVFPFVTSLIWTARWSPESCLPPGRQSEALTPSGPRNTTPPSCSPSDQGRFPSFSPSATTWPLIIARGHPSGRTIDWSRKAPASAARWRRRKFGWRPLGIGEIRRPT